MDVKKYRMNQGLSTKDVVNIIKAQYPKYSKITHCMVENPEKYGVKLVPEAEDLLTAKSPRKGDRHRNRYRLSCRVTKSRYEAVKQAIEEDGRFPSVQSFLDWWVYVWLRQKTAAPGAGTSESGAGKNDLP